MGLCYPLIMSIESEIAKHYSKKDASETERGNDHLHIGGEKATRYFFDKLAINAGMRMLDIGCGIGGPALLAAKDYGCHVTGIDLTPDFIATARANAKAAHLENRTDFQTANANELPVPDSRFDLAVMLHVGMNIPNKSAVFTEAARILKPNGVLALYDILALENVVNMAYPCPWAKTRKTSFLDNIDAIERQMGAAGLEITSTENCRDYADKSITKMIETISDDLSTPRKISVQNLLSNIQNNACAPFIIIARKAS